MTASGTAGRGGGSAFRRLLGFLKPYRWIFAASLALSVAGAAFDAFSLLLLIPFLRSLFDMGPLLPEGGRNAAERLIDDVVGGRLGGLEGLEGLRAVCLVLFAAIVLKNACTYGARVLGIRVQELLERDARDTIHAHLQRLPLGFFEREKAGQVIARVLTDTTEAKPVVTDALAQTVRQAATVVAYVAAMFVLSWRLSLLALTLVPLIVLALRPILRRLRARFRQVFDDKGELLSALEEAVGGIRLVKSSGAEAFEERRFRARSDSYSRRRILAASTSQLASPLSEVLASAVAVSLIWIGAGQVLGAGTLGPEQFLAFITIALRAISPLKKISQYPTLAQQGMAAADRFFEILDEREESRGGSRVATGVRKEIRFEGVTFEYEEGRAVLRDIDLVIPRGDVVALVGPSGGGKSTLVDLLPRFGDPKAGRVTIDGVDIREFTLESLRRLIGHVSQQTTLFHDTVTANIAYGDVDRSAAEVEAAARAAHAHDFISGLPDGYETLLGDRGVRLSGGQRQRIALARAILRDTPILILDEATSALDDESERAVKEALDELFGKRTVIVIAHRLATVREADAIFVLDGGRIVDRGTHEELLGRPGPYRRLFGRQAASSARQASAYAP
ncbi:MAG: ABC transporter transmembrane domain-containing protein [Gemmatimonadota bacterium]|nr:ABC transporter transmembrane domain-containing protein [Gemmatimonadota bacterium]